MRQTQNKEKLMGLLQHRTFKNKGGIGNKDEKIIQNDFEVFKLPYQSFNHFSYNSQLSDVKLLPPNEGSTYKVRIR